MAVRSEAQEERVYQAVKRPYEFGSFTFEDGGFKVAPARIESQYPNAFRQAMYPNGKVVVQGAYAWSEGSIGGIIWKDLPLVCVDDEGKEIK